MEKVIFIVGPTGIGKTKLSINIASILDAEIISADSMQIYTSMDIGTAKVSVQDMEGINHHFIDIVKPDERFTVDDYQSMAHKTIMDITAREKLPIVVGGTGLYTNSLLYQLEFLGESNPTIRNKYQDLYENRGKEALFQVLMEVDPASAKRIHPNNVQRVIRALEIYETTGKTMSSQNKGFRIASPYYEPYIIGLQAQQKEFLHSQIELRVDSMLSLGLVSEVRNLLKEYPLSTLTSGKGIGYKEVISYIQGYLTFDEMRSLIIKKTKQFAKRQYTWFKKDDRVVWEYVNESTNLEDLANKQSKQIQRWRINE